MNSAEKIAPWWILMPLVLGACIQIVGIEDPKPIEDKPLGNSTSASSTTGSGGSGGMGSSSSGSGGSSSGGSSGPWVSWPMPNPPTANLPNPANYTVDQAKDIVTDNVTGLLWQRTIDNTLWTWADAITYCDNLTLGGYTDWRLPWRIELVSLIDYTLQFPAIDPAFPNTPNERFWSATPLANDNTMAWMVYFDDGETYGDFNTNTYYARCVRSK